MIGVGSHGPVKSEIKGEPDVYSLMSSFIDWIQSKLIL